MSDDLPEPIRKRLLRRRVGYDLCWHEDYDSHGEATRDAKVMLDLHRQKRERNSLPAFRKKRLWRLEQKYESVTGQTISDGLEEAQQELEELNTLQILVPWLL